MIRQTERVLQYLRDYGSITQLDALREFGCMRLGARIYDLKRQGHDIRTTRETAQNRYGEKISYARYTMGGRNAGV